MANGARLVLGILMVVGEVEARLHQHEGALIDNFRVELCGRPRTSTLPAPLRGPRDTCFRFLETDDMIVAPRTE
jgi:hypothetical protein